MKKKLILLTLLVGFLCSPVLADFFWSNFMLNSGISIGFNSDGKFTVIPELGVGIPGEGYIYAKISIGYTLATGKKGKQYCGDYLFAEGSICGYGRILSSSTEFINIGGGIAFLRDKKTWRLDLVPRISFKLYSWMGGVGTNFLLAKNNQGKTDFCFYAPNILPYIAIFGIEF